ncbi:hypothetical protein SAMN05660235_00946 [Sporolituus thermophilus DSM 23256]|uniref:Uncharacterized protein n=1 Tax=Sporolituus thermophilus DSM 23256 TaxID=1123285 RepID=A0A1G7JJD7_9FIRM|nr:hypothetical protein SAMN05660235_00946 [Sporolituus thermophilus DSM 23256]
MFSRCGALPSAEAELILARPCDWACQKTVPIMKNRLLTV